MFVCVTDDTDWFIKMISFISNSKIDFFFCFILSIVLFFAWSSQNIFGETAYCWIFLTSFVASVAGCAQSQWLSLKLLVSFAAMSGIKNVSTGFPSLPISTHSVKSTSIILLFVCWFVLLCFYSCRVEVFLEDTVLS